METKEKNGAAELSKRKKDVAAEILKS